MVAQQQYNSVEKCFCTAASEMVYPSMKSSDDRGRRDGKFRNPLDTSPVVLQNPHASPLAIIAIQCIRYSCDVAVPRQASWMNPVSCQKCLCILGTGWVSFSILCKSVHHYHL